MKTLQLNETIKEISEELTLGRVSTAKNQLAKLVIERKTTKAPREQKLEIAKLFRRAGMWIEALKLLHPFVRTEKKSTGEELVEYAASLIQIGARREANDLLLNPLALRIKSADLFQAFLHFSKWEYAEAIPYLDRYTHAPGLSPYEKAVAQVNLFAAKAIGESSEKLLKELIKFEQELFQSNYLRLAANINEIMSQTLIALKHFSEADQRLDKVIKNGSISPLEHLLALKWKAVCTLEQSPRQKRAQEKLLSLRSQAHEVKHYETLRDIDYHFGRITRDQTLLEKLFIGTPHPAYQKRIVGLLEIQTPSESYLWQISYKKSKSFFVLDSRANENNWLDQGDLDQRIISVLSRDFYAPSTIAELHASLFPNEYFNPYSSPNRIHAAIYRLNLAFKSNSVPVRVSRYDEGYRLIAPKSNAGILVYRRDELADRFTARMNHLKKNTTPAVLFSRGDAVRIWQVSDRTANVLLQRAADQGQLQKVGRGPSTRYQFKA